jgi:hypothetical protein
MDYFDPNDRAEVIMQKLNALSNKLLTRLHQELLYSIPHAKLIKNKIILHKNNNRTKLEVSVPVTEDLCSQCRLFSEERTFSMAWTVKAKLSDGTILSNIEPVIHPLSATRIIEWINDVNE